jgi:Regulator of chromosome condensation (RCC1) repeat
VCWGSNGNGKSTVPTRGGVPLRFVSVSAGGEHTCGVAANGTAICWGDDSVGQASVPPGFG